MKEIERIIKAHKEAIEDLETIQTALNTLSNMVNSEYSSLYGMDVKPDENGDLHYQLRNPRAPQIVEDIIDLIVEHYMIATPPVKIDGIEYPVDIVPDEEMED